VATQVIILNGGSSSGKSGIARCLQAVLPDPWLAFGTDTLTEAMPASMQSSAAGIQIAPDGEVSIGPEFRTLEAAWITGIAAMARAGARIIVDEVFLGGPASQQRWKTALAGLQVLWVGIRCESAGDRCSRALSHMARRQSGRDRYGFGKAPHRCWREDVPRARVDQRDLAA